MIRRAELLEQGADVDAASIESWLNIFARLLRLSGPRRQAVLDELESHLRERVRDLMLAGEREHDALCVAIEELGSAAELAERLRLAHRPPTRRLVMNIAAIGTGAAAVVTAALLVSSETRPGTVFYEPLAATPDERSALDDLRLNVEFKQTPLSEVLSFFGNVLESDVVVHWCGLEECGIDPGRPVSLTVKHGRSVSAILSLVSEMALVPSTGQAELDWRYRDNLLEFATRAHFDRREVVLATFDLDPVVERLGRRHQLNEEQAIEKVCELIYNYVEADSWEANGGNVARLTVVGTKMFVRAPARYHAQIQWIVEQLSEDGQPSGQGRGVR